MTINPKNAGRFTFLGAIWGKHAIETLNMFPYNRDKCIAIARDLSLCINNFVSMKVYEVSGQECLFYILEFK